MYFNVNFNVFFKLIKVHLSVRILNIYQNAWCNNKKKNQRINVYPKLHLCKMVQYEKTDRTEYCS